MSTQSSNTEVRYESKYWSVYLNDFFVQRFKTKAEADAFAATL